MSPRKRYTVTLDDDPLVSKVIEAATGLPTLAFTSVKEALDHAAEVEPVAAFVDIQVGEECGLDIIPVLRKKWFGCPILVITGDPTDAAVRNALASGADDFITKPLRPVEIVARMQARLQDREEKDAKQALRIGDLVLDTSHRALRGKKGRRDLSETEVNLLKCLQLARGTVVSRDSLKWHGWGETNVSDNALDRKMHDLRKILQETSARVSLRNVYGEGFVLAVGNREVGEMKTKKVLSEKKLREIRELNGAGQPDLLAELAGLFFDSAPGVYAELRRALTEKQSEKAARIAHKLKGMCQNIGADTLAELCEFVEKNIRTGKYEECTAKLSSFDAEYEEVVAALRGRLKEAA